MSRSGFSVTGAPTHGLHCYHRDSVLTESCRRGVLRIPKLLESGDQPGSATSSDSTDSERLPGAGWRNGEL